MPARSGESTKPSFALVVTNGDVCARYPGCWLRANLLAASSGKSFDKFLGVARPAAKAFSYLILVLNMFVSRLATWGWSLEIEEAWKLAFIVLDFAPKEASKVLLAAVMFGYTTYLYGRCSLLC